MAFGVELTTNGETQPRVIPVTRHAVWHDEPSAQSTRLRKTVCSTWAPPRDVAARREDVTCPECVFLLDQYDRMEF